MKERQALRQLDPGRQVKATCEAVLDHIAGLYNCTSTSSVCFLLSIVTDSNHQTHIHSTALSLSPMSSLSSSVLLLILMFTASVMAVSTVNFYQDVEFYWGSQNANVSDGGKNLTMSLYNSSGCGFQSYNTYLFGRFDMHIMLVPNNSAGTITTSYVISKSSTKCSFAY